LEILLTFLLNEVEKTVKRKLLIVLDDYHMVQDNQEIHDAMDYILKHLPLRLHVVFISRSRINLALSRMRAMRHVVDITAEDLVFTAEEIHQLFKRLFHMDLSEEGLKTIRRQTEGWVVGLILVYHILKGKRGGDISRLPAEVKGAGRIIGEYLEENVYDGLDKGLKRFLAKTSILLLKMKKVMNTPIIICFRIFFRLGFIRSTGPRRCRDFLKRPAGFWRIRGPETRQ